MSMKPRPTGCCDAPVDPAPMPATDRTRLLGWFKALSDPTRLEIYRLVAAQQAPLCACDIVSRFDLSQPTVSHHLRILAQSGLVRVSREGVWAYYEADPAGSPMLGLVEAGQLIPVG